MLTSDPAMHGRIRHKSHNMQPKKPVIDIVSQKWSDLQKSCIFATFQEIQQYIEKSRNSAPEEFDKLMFYEVFM